MTLFDILNLILGLSLFLFGMNLMGETLKKSAGRKLKVFLEKLTSTPTKGLLLGTLVTAIIQSSSASTVMVVGFVNSGTMLLSQAVSVIMGANVGTSVTSWITALSGIEGGGAFGSVMQWFKPASFTPVVALIGLILYMVGKNEGRKNTGIILLGFSVLMMGMETMSGAVEGLENNESFRSLLLLFENPLLGVIAGMLLTAIIQSSSASIGILQSFTATGAITFGNAVPIILGQNIGTCVTAIISSAGTNKNAKRASLIHLFFNVFGSVISISGFCILKYLIAPVFLEGPINMWGIATVHTLFNLITVVFLFPFSSKLEKLTLFIVRDRDKDKNEEFNFLDERLLVTPSIALEKSREMAIIMAEASMRSVDRACDNLNEFSEKGAAAVRRDESLADECEDKLGTYLLKVSGENILEEEHREISKLLRMIGDFERISDHAVNIVESAEEMRDKKISFSEEARGELNVLINAVREISELSLSCISKEDFDQARQVEPLEQIIDRLCKTVKSRHIIRLQQNKCTMEQGFILTDIVTDLERVADHCSNIAACFIEVSEHNTMDMHNYLKEYRVDSKEFAELFEKYERKYSL